MAEVPRIDLAKLIRGKGVDEAAKILESGELYIKVYAIPRPRAAKIRTAKKKLMELDEGRIARLEYALIRASIQAAKAGRKPVFKEFAELAGDYKAAAVYLSYLWRSGLVVFDKREDALNIFIASTALSQKTYEHKIAKALNAPFHIDAIAFEKLPSDEIYCVYREGTIGCKYLVANCERSQAKAEVKGLVDALRG